MCFAHLSGKRDPDDPLPELINRHFIEIDHENFNKVLAGMKPRLAFRVDCTLTDDNSKIAVELKFKSIDDFNPDNVARGIYPLKKLLDARCKLNELLTKIQNSPVLDKVIRDVLSNSTQLEKLAVELEHNKAEHQHYYEENNTHAFDKCNNGEFPENSIALNYTKEEECVEGPSILDKIISNGGMAYWWGSRK